MSESMSTTLTTSSFLNDFFNLSNENMYMCSMFQLKLILFIIFLTIITCSIVGIIYTPKNYKNRCIEDFSNDQFYAYDSAPYSMFKNTELTAPISEDGSPENLLFGSVNRIINTIDSKLHLEINIYANMYIINGNIFGKTIEDKNELLKQTYKVFLKKGNKVKYLDKLELDGDKLYKLKFQTNNQDLINEILVYDEIYITHNIDSSDKILLKGKF